MNKTPRIPSPIPYLMQVPDLRAHNTTYDWRMLFMLVLMSLGSGRTNVLAIPARHGSHLPIGSCLPDRP